MSKWTQFLDKILYPIGEKIRAACEIVFIISTMLFMAWTVIMISYMVMKFFWIKFPLWNILPDPNTVYGIIFYFGFIALYELRKIRKAMTRPEDRNK